jgi:hypothetical protein
MTAPSCHRWKAGLLGLFVTWQLVYLPAANLIQFVPLRVRQDTGDTPLSTQEVGRFTENNRLQTLADAVGAGLTRYAEASGQVQFWKLFTPELPPYTVVLVTRLEFGDGRSVDMVSPYGPADDPPSYRLPRWDLRPFNFETHVGLGPWAVTPELIARDPATARDLTVGWAEIRSEAVRTVMRHHASVYQALHPHAKDPYGMTLYLRYTAKPAVGATGLDGPAVFDRPFVRWHPPIAKSRQLSVFDPVDGRFVPLPEGRQ